MLEFTFKSDDQIILQFVISQTTGASPEVITGDDSWFDYSFAPYSERDKRNVSLNDNLEEWAYQLQQAYSEDGEIDLAVRYLEEPEPISSEIAEEALSASVFDDSQIEEAKLEGSGDNKPKENLPTKLAGVLKEIAVWLRVVILVALVLIAGFIIKSCAASNSSKEKPGKVFSDKSLNEILSEGIPKKKKTNTNPDKLQKAYLKEQARREQARIRNYQRQLEAKENIAGKGSKAKAKPTQ